MSYLEGVRVNHAFLFETHITVKNLVHLRNACKMTTAFPLRMEIRGLFLFVTFLN